MPQVSELPKSLQQMIADSQSAVAIWNPADDENIPGMNYAHDWTLRLSRGEYDQDLYWNCVADDCEKIGDWEGAMSAYRQILNAPDELGFTHSRALCDLASIQCLKGEDDAALRSYHLATEKSADESVVLGHMRFVSEASQSLRMGHIRRARKLIRQGLVQVPDEFVDYLGTARLLIEWAKCDLACSKPESAALHLQNAWDWLDALVQSFAADPQSLQQASGIHIAHAAWWLTEAKRRRMVREENSELIALKHAIEKVRLCFTPCGYQRPWYDLRLMNLLLQLADACERHGMPEDAAAPRKEAEEIFTTRRFPESAKWPRYDDWPPTRFAFSRSWREIFRRRID